MSWLSVGLDKLKTAITGGSNGNAPLTSIGSVLQQGAVDATALQAAATAAAKAASTAAAKTNAANAAANGVVKAVLNPNLTLYLLIAAVVLLLLDRG